MAFIDEIKIYLKAGKGGDGVVRWLHERGKDKAGPAGGDGGNGADIYARGVRDLSILARYRNIKEYLAPNGEDGGSSSMHGKNGEDFILDLPIGSIVKNEETGRTVELVEENAKEILLHGGRGGWGNEHFKSSTNRSPKETTLGEVGEEALFSIELQLIADAGLIGLPNAGKSSLLNALTRARAKVASYQFTTLEPNLGEMYGYILADIPGLIEGAAEGKGLGHKFLRHIKRTKVLLHCISLENEDIEETYKIVRQELDKYSPELTKKQEVIILTKTDMISEEELKKKEKIARAFSKNVLGATILDDASVKLLAESITKMLGK
ncbi:MAG: GTPase ObgE [bacterium]|nr:GTPase ObgE [bacterium]